MSDKYQTALRLQLLALGYSIIPNKNKKCFVDGWSTPEFAAREHTPERIKSWPRRFPDAPATGLRLENGVGAIDLDVDHPIVDALMERIAVIAPDVAARAPTRYGGGTHKIALFVQVEGEPFDYVHSRRYIVDGKKHHVEIFGDKPTKKGTCARQFGIIGPHSEGVNYAFAEGVPALTDVAPRDLPKLTRAQASAIVDAFDELARGLGWEPVKALAVSANDGEAVYDITDETRFDTDRAGYGLTYAELAAACGEKGELRCTSSFMAGRSGTDPTRCWVKHTPRHGCVAVYVYGDGQTHYPIEKKPLDPAVFAADLKAVAELHNVTLPADLPNWRERTKGGIRPAPSLHNACLAIEAAGLTCSHDVFHNKMFIGRGEAADPSEPIPRHCGEVTDGRVMALRGHLSARYGFDLQDKHVRDAIVLLAGANSFNPVTDMLAEAEASWDGVARLDRMAADYFGCADTELNRQCVRKTMIAAVARARRPGCKFDTILVLESPEGWNKSTAWAVLAGEGNFSDERIIGKENRDVVEQLAGVWIHENADLAGMRKAEVETVKAYASRTVDRARPAYAHYLVEQPRHSIEIGTTNNDEYLQSQTGNRRFWPMRMERRIDLGKLRAHRLQLWGEAARAEAAGEALTLPEELWGEAAIEQDVRRVRDAWEDTLAERLTVVVANVGPLAGVGRVVGVVQVVEGEERVAARAVFETVLGLPASALDDRHTKRLANAMRALGWSRGQFRIGGEKVRGYYRKVKGT